MKNFVIVVIGSVIILLITAIILFWPHGTKLTIGSMQISGIAGTEFNGYYVQGRQKVPISGVLPWSLHTRVTEFEVRKADPAKTITVRVSYGKVGSREAFNETVVGEAVIGVRGRVQSDGLHTQSFDQ